MELVKSIADRGYQKRIWILGEGPEWDSFDDTVCNFFGNCDGVLNNYKDFGITESQYQILKNFRDEFDIFSNGNHWLPDFIDTPEWEKIAEMAKEVLDAFNYPEDLSENTQNGTAPD